MEVKRTLIYIKIKMMNYSNMQLKYSREAPQTLAKTFIEK